MSRSALLRSGLTFLQRGPTASALTACAAAALCSTSGRTAEAHGRSCSCIRCAHPGSSSRSATFATAALSLGDAAASPRLLAARRLRQEPEPFEAEFDEDEYEDGEFEDDETDEFDEGDLEEFEELEDEDEVQEAESKKAAPGTTTESKN